MSNQASIEDELDPALAATKALLTALQHGKFEDARHHMILPVRLALSAEKLAKAWNYPASIFGPIESISKVRYHKQGYLPITKALVLFQKATFAVTVRLGPANAVMGINLHAPIAVDLAGPWTTPEYVNEDSFEEKSFKLNPFWLWPGVEASIAVPKSGGKKPAVLILQGSGVSDLDISIGSQKPAKDLAWGLASAGIVVLRIGKPLAWIVYRHQVVGDVNADDEYLYSGIAALKALAKRSFVDASQIYVAGLSGGGRSAPRLCQQSPVPVAGMISIAGLAQPFAEALISQGRYLQNHFPKDQKEHEDEVTKLKELSDGLKHGVFTKKSANPIASMPIPIPLAYFIHDEQHQPTSIVKDLDMRILIMQGMLDWQVVPEENLASWHESLRGHEAKGQATFRTYPHLPHTFVAFNSTRHGLKQYDEHGNVASEVVADIVHWIQST